MEYVIVYLIKGRAEDYHNKFARELSKKFGVNCVSNIVMPHLTIKDLGEIKNKKELLQIEDLLTNFVRSHSKSSLSLEKVNHFTKEVIFLEAKPSKQMTKIYLELYKEITQIKWVKKIPKYEGKNIHFHATLVAHDISNNFEEIFSYASKKACVFPLEFDNLTIIKKVNGKWVIHKSFNL